MILSEQPSPNGPQITNEDYEQIIATDAARSARDRVQSSAVIRFLQGELAKQAKDLAAVKVELSSLKSESKITGATS